MKQEIDVYFQEKPNHYAGNIGVTIDFTNMQHGVADLIARKIIEGLGNIDFSVNIKT